MPDPKTKRGPGKPRQNPTRKEVDQRMAAVKTVSTVPVGFIPAAEFAVKCGISNGGLTHAKNAGKFVLAVSSADKNSSLPLVLMSDDPDAQEEALKICGDKKPLIYAARAGNFDSLVNLAKQYSSPLAVYGKDLEETAALTGKAAAAGVKELVIDPGSRGAKSLLSRFLL